MERSMPENYKPILYKNTIISEGPPSVWQLAPQKKRSGKVITVKAVGLSEESSKSVRTVLLLGETGNGKSTLINALFNFAIGVKWEENIWFEIMDEDSEDQTQSQTSEVTIYELPSDNLDFSLRVIDSPGLGDTRGSDELLTHRLLDIFQSQDGVREVHAVGLVLKASENRLTDRMAYVFNSVTSLFDKDMEQKIVPLITHSDGRKPTNALQALETANVKSARDENNKPLYFLFDNCQRDDRTEGTKYLEYAYGTSMENMENFMKFLQQQKSKDLGETVKVLTERKELAGSINHLQTQVRLITQKEKDMEQAKEAERKYEEKMKNNENFTTEQIELIKHKEPVNSRLLSWISNQPYNCLNCLETCYYSGTKDNVIKDGRCTSIACRSCAESDHHKGDFKFVSKLVKKTNTDEDKKARYERNKSKKEQKSKEIENLQRELSALKQTKDQSVDEAFEIIMKLEQIALNVDFTYVHLDFLIENLKKRGDTEKVQTLEGMSERMDETVKAGAKYLEHIRMSGESAPQKEQQLSTVSDASAPGPLTGHTSDDRKDGNSVMESKV